MTFGQLRTYLAVAETGSVRAAAERLVVTQSAVSAALAALHRELGVALVERDGRGLRLTPAGRVYAGYANVVLGTLEEGRNAALAAQDPARGRLRIAAVTTAAEHLLPLLVAGLLARHPGIELSVGVGTREEVVGMLRGHTADVAVAGRPPAGLVSRAVRPNELVVVAAPALAAGAAGVRELPWLLRGHGSGTRETTAALLEQLQADPPVLTLGSNGAVVAGAVAGLGVTLVSRDAVRDLVQAGRLVELRVPGTPLTRPWHLVTRRAAPATAELFVAHALAEGTWRRPPGRAR
jgi:DNA-binding transcriptional LysR family regulator